MISKYKNQSSGSNDSAPPERRDPPKNIWRRGQFRPDAGPCLIKRECGSCLYVNEDYTEGLKHKYAKNYDKYKKMAIFRGAQITPPTPSPLHYEYRNHAKLAVRPYTAAQAAIQSSEYPADAPPRRFAIGLYKPGSHEVVPMDRCPLHRSSINDVLYKLQPLLDTSPLTPYNEARHQGQLRYIAIRSNHLTSEVMLSFVCIEDCRRELKTIVKELRTQGCNIASAYLNLNPEVGNRIFGEQNIHLAGAKKLRESLCELDFELSPTAFFQINPKQAEQVYRRIEQWLPSPKADSVAWDLYCGIGTISNVLARRGFKVWGLEESPEAIEDARSNAKRNQNDTSCDFVAGRAEQQIIISPEWAQSPKVIIANPSRRGMDPAVRGQIRQTLLDHPGCRLIYLSCEIESMVRDLEEICGQDLQVRQWEAFDMFPFTEKLEWLALVINPS